MSNEQLIERVRGRRADPATRIDMETLPVPPLYEPVAASVVTASEGILGVTFPPFLGTLYHEVGNGGFGPGAGLIGLNDGYGDADERTLVELYQYFMSAGWSAGLLPLFDWGDGAWSTVDARTTVGTIVTADESGFTETPFSLESWLTAWVDDVDLHSEIFEIEDATIGNPFTGELMTVKNRGKPKGRLLSHF